jgi:GNAT superfamily N-acetyltransferase
VRIDYLANHSHRLREVAQWHYREWPSIELDGSLDSRERLLAPCCQRNAIPLAVIALDQDILCGSALLVEQDFDLRPDLSPWLAGVFVPPRYRKNGVASALVTRIETEAALLAVKNLYLYTAHAETLYARLGWQVLEHSVHRHRNYVVMTKAL